jgi:DNA-binding response OmpR family regulator
LTKILYIEDEELLGKIVKETLLHLGFHVAWVTDGAMALEAFRESNPDICIIDIMLPNIDGYTIGRNIRGLNPSMPVIFLTARSETKDVLKGFE